MCSITLSIYFPSHTAVSDLTLWLLYSSTYDSTPLGGGGGGGGGGGYFRKDERLGGGRENVMGQKQKSPNCPRLEIIGG